jgi:hypothetical protein
MSREALIGLAAGLVLCSGGAALPLVVVAAVLYFMFDLDSLFGPLRVATPTPPPRGLVRREAPAVQPSSPQFYRRDWTEQDPDTWHHPLKDSFDPDWGVSFEDYCDSQMSDD